MLLSIDMDSAYSPSVFPEMKTALRTYHPVPSLQKTDGNAQDAPRIKNCLKAALLPSETKGVPPATPEEVLAKRVRYLLRPISPHHPIHSLTLMFPVHPFSFQREKDSAHRPVS